MDESCNITGDSFNSYITGSIEIPINFLEFLYDFFDFLKYDIQEQIEIAK